MLRRRAAGRRRRRDVTEAASRRCHGGTEAVTETKSWSSSDVNNTDVERRAVTETRADRATCSTATETEAES
ncbi:DUF1836 domain-containing protein [Sesbania bispinosa]|nr:DUF1836 domain-containing protein [Sesbania bispinosa]